jgi:hypothetical protein
VLAPLVKHVSHVGRSFPWHGHVLLFRVGGRIKSGHDVI